MFAGTCKCFEDGGAVLTSCWAAPPSGSAVLTCVLEYLVDVFLGDEARTRADIARPVGRSEPIGAKPRLELRIRFEGLADLDRVGGVILLYDSQHRDRDITL